MVKSGDTMYTIAQKYGVKLEQLIAFNPQISNPDQIEVGMKVKIPSGAIHDGTPAVDYAHKHVVVQGDSLWKIAKAWGLPLKAMVDANPQLKNPSVLLTGEIVNIPKSTHMPNQGTSNTMGAAHMPVQPNLSNSISPAYVPHHMNAPHNINAPQPINVPQPTAVQPVMETPPKPKEQLVQPEAKSPVAAESINENMPIQPSETLFNQFDVPAVEASGKASGKSESMPSYTMPSYTMPQWSPEAMPQWGPGPAAMPQYETSPAYAAKPDCGCGCGDKVNAMPYNQYQAPYSTSPNYYMPESMQGYSMQDPMQFQPQQPVQESYNYPMQGTMPMHLATHTHYYNQMQGTMPMQQAQMPYYNPEQESMPMQHFAQPSQYNQMQFPTSAAPSSPYGYPMGAYGDMNYIHGMQMPYSPWLNSNENAPPANTLAESAENANINGHMNNVLGAADVDAPVKKRTKIPRNSSSRSSNKQNDRDLLHNFLQKKSSGMESSRELKINEPWLNR
jgi:morphogenetic protein associated with SpoVID